MAYQLAGNRTELKLFAAMEPLAAARYFGKLEAAHLDKSPKPETKISNAPKPIRTVGARATTAATFDLASASLADYRRARESGRLR